MTGNDTDDRDHTGHADHTDLASHTDPPPSHATLDYTVRDRVGTVTFTRPERLNSITEQVLADLADVVATVRADPSVHVLVITGSGGAFCVGLDLDLLDRAFADLDYFDGVLRRLAVLLRSLEELDVPVVAMVEGLARAGGFELALACDVVVVADTARIGDVHTSFGLVPGGGSSFRLPRLVGPQRAKEILFSGRWLTGAQAAKIGIAHSAVPAAELSAAVDALVTSFAAKSRDCLAAVKRQVDRVAGRATPECVEIEREEFLGYLGASGSDGVEGFRAYREGRPPSWAPR